MNITPLANRLKQLRKLNNYSQQMVADELNVIRQTYSHYETGRNYPNTEILYKLSKLYDIPVESLMKLAICDEDYFKSNELNNKQNTTELNDNQDLSINFKNLSTSEKKLLLYFQKLPEDEQEDILGFIKQRATRQTV